MTYPSLLFLFNCRLQLACFLCFAASPELNKNNGAGDSYNNPFAASTQSGSSKVHAVKSRRHEAKRTRAPRPQGSPQHCHRLDGPDCNQRQMRQRNRCVMRVKSGREVSRTATNRPAKKLLRLPVTAWTPRPTARHILQHIKVLSISCACMISLAQERKRTHGRSHLMRPPT